jgi:hypothetical protein
MKSVKVRSLVGHQNSEDNPITPSETIKGIPFTCCVSTKSSVSPAMIASGLIRPPTERMVKSRMIVNRREVDPRHRPQPGESSDR